MSKKIIISALVALSCIILLVAALYVPLRTIFFHDQAPLKQAAASYAGLMTSSTTPEVLHIPIFIYHSVRPDFLGESVMQKSFSITPETFEAQLQYLETHGYTSITLDELELDIENGTTSPIAKPVVLTFDDGNRNQYEYAFPLLKKYHDTATFFIYTNPIGKDPDFMTWDQVKELDAAGMTIGDHTLSHPYLSKLTPQELRIEVLGAKLVLEDHLGKSVVHFASPFGSTSDELVALLKEAGFKTGRTTDKGAYHSKDDILRLTGFLVHRDLRDFTWALEHSP